MKSALLALCAGNPLGASGFPTKKVSHAERVSISWWFLSWQCLALPEVIRAGCQRIFFGGRNSPLFSPAISSATNVNTAMNTYKLWSIHHTETSLLPHEQAAFTGTMAEQTTQALQVSTNTVPSSVSHSRMDQWFENLIDWLDQISFYVLPSRTAYCNTSNLSFANKFQANASFFWQNMYNQVKWWYFCCTFRDQRRT